MTKDEAIEKAFTNYLDGDTIDVCLGRWSAESFYAGYAAAKPRWIPVEERLPEKSDIYYVTCHDGVVRKSAFYVGAFDRSAIAWMPKAKMPEPFEPKDK